MSRERQIEEISIEVREAVNGCSSYWSGLIAEHLYEQGYRKQEWISVEERLPIDSQTVLVVLNGKITGQTVIAMGSGCDGRWLLMGTGNTSSEKYKITHWMPLPEAPKMKGGAE